MPDKCHCHFKKAEECPIHGIAAANAREDKYWQGVYFREIIGVVDVPRPELWKLPERKE